MTLSNGTRLGPYEIVSPLGAGGMGKVYRARDTRLERAIAVKVLPEEFFDDRERVARFEGEARALATLNHPGIAAVHSFEAIDGRHILVMELVEGEGLDVRIARGPIPLDEGLPIARQIAEALEAAHERGIVHRDLKPANIMVAPDGRVKLLDFGLAKAFERPLDAAGREQAAATGYPMAQNSPTALPTATGGLTQAGVILGTAAYMSPEQARGKALDKRTDIWAFGCVLFEMLTGTRLFEGETVSDTLAAVLTREPGWQSLPSSTPSALQNLLRRCLVRDPKRRLRDIGEARIALAEDASGAEPAESAVPPAAPVSRWLRALPWTVAVLIAAAALAFSAVRGRAPVPRQPVMRFDLAPPEEDSALWTDSAPPLLLSPDGTRLVLVAGKAMRWQLSLRPVEQDTAAPLLGTEGALDPFFSPDGRQIGFFANGVLKRTAVSGGNPETICPAPNDRGGAWAEDGSILFTPTTDAPLFRVPAGGGAPAAVTALDIKARERSHRWPDLLPGGKAALFSIAYEVGNPLDDAAVAVTTFAGRHRVLIKGASFPRYAPTGHIVYAQRGSLFAVPFDPVRIEVTGPPVAVADRVMMSRTKGNALSSFSKTGALVYVSGDVSASEPTSLVWVDRRGAEQVLNPEQRVYVSLRLTRDGRIVVAEIRYPLAGIWAYDIARGTLSRLTLAGASYNPMPSPDGKSVVYAAVRDGTAGLFRTRLDGAKEERLTSTKEAHTPTSFSPDGRLVAFTAGGRNGRSEIWTVALEGNATPAPLLQTPYNVDAGTFSPDGRSIAYVSDESGRFEVYVRPYSGSGGRVQISTGGGTEPLWSPDGQELFFRNGDEFLAVEIGKGAVPEAGRPH
ncbi:MAG TPA: protein kinase, partial [Thermoanaerobaculia bacterium]|nr:protein kinase [Thermoanaerobaculia bacterium]